MIEQVRSNLARGLTHLTAGIDALNALESRDDLPGLVGGNVRRAVRELSEARECFERSSRFLRQLDDEDE